MPAAAAIPWLGTAIAGAATGTAAIVGSKIQSGSAKRAGQIQSQSDQAAIQFQREQEAERKREYDAQQAEAKAQWEATQKFQQAQWDAQEEQRLHTRQLEDATEARRAPYRAASQSALMSLGDLLGLKFDAGSAPGILGDRPASGGGGASMADVSPELIGEVPKTVEEAMAQANKIAYGGAAKHTDASYWKDWAKDPVYSYKRMLGWQAGGSDAPTSGPYAGKSGGSATAPTTIASAGRPAAAMMAPTAPTQLVTATDANYAPVIPMSALLRRQAQMRA